MLQRVINIIRALIDRNQFYPSYIGAWTNPFWLCRRALWHGLREHAPRLAGSVLDFGCGTSPYRNLLTAGTQYIGLEYDIQENRLHKRADIFYDGQTIPLGDGSIDNVLSTQTLEHVPNPERIMAEWARVLRPGGLLLLTVPFMWPEHEMPYDFQRYTTNGLCNLLEKNNFEVLTNERLLCDCRAPAQLFLAWLYDALRLAARSFVVNLALTAFLFAPVSLLATFLAIVTPQNTNTYMDNLILARRIGT